METAKMDNFIQKTKGTPSPPYPIHTYR